MEPVSRALLPTWRRWRASSSCGLFFVRRTQSLGLRAMVSDPSNRLFDADTQQHCAATRYAGAWVSQRNATTRQLIPTLNDSFTACLPTAPGQAPSPDFIDCNPWFLLRRDQPSSATTPTRSGTPNLQKRGKTGLLNSLVRPAGRESGGAVQELLHIQ
jgi:hypothetical protein